MADTALDTRPPSMLFPALQAVPVSTEAAPPPPPPAEGDQPQADQQVAQAFEPGWMPGKPAAPPAQVAPTEPPSGQPPQRPPPTFDENQEEEIRSQNEQRAYDSGLLDHRTGKQLRAPDMVSMDDWQKEQIKELRGIADSLPTKRGDYWRKRADDLEKQINSDLGRQNAQLHREYVQRTQDDMRKATALHQQRTADDGAMDAAYGLVYDSTIKPDLSSTDPATKLNGDFHRRTSPFMTMSRPVQGEDPDKFEQRNKQQFITLAQTLRSLNPQYQPDQIVNYMLAVGSPVDTRQDPGAPGFNQLHGKAGTNYKVLPGHDAADNWMLRMPDGRILRVDPATKTILDRARSVGFVQSKAWMKEQADLKAKSEQPGLLERGFESIFGSRPPKAGQ